MRFATLLIGLFLLATQAGAAPLHWVGAWAAPPAPPLVGGGDTGRFSPSFSNQTLIQRVRLDAGGARLRVRFSNEYGTKPLALGGARVALLDAAGGVVAGSERTLTFAGAATVTVPPGAPLYSDPVTLKTQPLARLRVTLFLPADTGPCTCHATGEENAQVSPGDALAGSAAPPTTLPDYRAFLTGVEVETAGAGPVIVAFGDSITDGYRSTIGADHRWPDRLAERLDAAKSGGAVVNAGLSGNRMLADGFIPPMGQSALTRFDRDVLSVPGATHLIILEGVNDLGGGRGAVTADMLIAGYRQLIERAHAHGLKAIGATILPYEGANYFSAEGEAQRQAINAWIRTGKAFDAVIDFDAIMRDAAKATRMRADWQSGDWLHPNDAGYKAMGDAVDLRLFH